MKFSHWSHTMPADVPPQPFDTAGAREWREALRQRGRTVVFTNGCFDVLHAGHVAYLTWARAQGDALIVGLTTTIRCAVSRGRRARSFRSSSVPKCCWACAAWTPSSVFRSRRRRIARSRSPRRARQKRSISRGRITRTDRRFAARRPHRVGPASLGNEHDRHDRAHSEEILAPIYRNAHRTHR